MKITAFITLAAVLAFTEASPIQFLEPKHGHAVPLDRNPNYVPNTKAQIAKMNQRYNNHASRKGAAASSGRVPLVNVKHDLEYYGSVSVGTPAQIVKLDFDTVSK